MATLDTDHPVVRALDALVARCQARAPLWAPHDPDWPSACELGAPANDRIRWQPVVRDDYDLLTPLEASLEEPVHDDLKAFYGRYWSYSLETTAPQGHVSLLGIWNADDGERLLGNLLGHWQQQLRLFGLLRRRPMTLFFACTEPDSEYILSLANDSGEVLVERPGTRDRRVVAPSLADFLDSLVAAEPDV